MSENPLEPFLDLPEANGNASTNGGTYIWISRWREFQHYRPNPERGPAWIKAYTAQLSDERYLELTDRQRALLHDLRHVYAMTRGRLRRDVRTISRYRQRQTRDADLEALNHAGLVEFISRQTLDQRLDELYSDSSLDKEVDKEPPNPRRRGGLKPSTKKTRKTATVCPQCDVGGGLHTTDCPTVQPAVV